MPSSHYSGLWKNIPHCLTQIQMALTGRILFNAMENGARRVFLADMRKFQ